MPLKDKTFICKHHGEAPYYFSSQGSACCKLCRSSKASIYFQTIKETERFRRRDIRNANPELNRLRKREEWARRYAIRNGIKNCPLSYQRIWERDNGVCYLCDRFVELTLSHADHKIPLSKGGTHSEDNVAIVHPSCNLRKGNKTPKEVKQFLSV